MDIILMCLMGAVATWGIVEWARDDDDKDDKDANPGPDSEHEHQIHDEEDLVTGPEDDTVTASRMVDTINLRTGAGDDTVDLGINQGTVRSGEGEDHLTFTNSTDVAAYGGTGEDTLIGNNNASTSLFGGHGDDVIAAQFLNDRLTLSLADGGEGNDTLRATVESLDLNPVWNPTHVYVDNLLPPHLKGGQGEDRFEVNILVRDATEHDLSLNQRNLVITDFHPEQDELFVDPLAEGSAEGFVPMHYNFFPSQDGTYTDLRINYLGPVVSGIASETFETIRIMGSGFSTAQISVLGLEQNLSQYSGDAEEIAVADGETVIARGGDDTITGTARDFVVYGGAGDDSFDGQGSGASLHGHAGNDTFNTDLSDSYVNAGTGHDALILNVEGSQIDGGRGHDSFTGTVLQSTLEGGIGNDEFKLDALGSSVINAGDGNDVIHHIEQLNYSTIAGGAGDDTIFAATQNNARWYGGHGNDDLIIDMSETLEEFSLYDAGHGDDRVSITLGSESGNASLLAGPQISFGEGKDIYEVSLNANVIANATGDQVDSAQILRLRDFTSGEDQLFLDPAASLASNMTFEGMSIERISSSESMINLRYTVQPTDGSEPYTQLQGITIHGTIASSDITLGPIPTVAA